MSTAMWIYYKEIFIFPWLQTILFVWLHAVYHLLDAIVTIRNHYKYQPSPEQKHSRLVHPKSTNKQAYFTKRKRYNDQHFHQKIIIIYRKAIEPGKRDIKEGLPTLSCNTSISKGGKGEKIHLMQIKSHFSNMYDDISC